MPVSTDDRYSRQVLFPCIGPAGQERLRRSSVAIVGCGATGSAAASLLARAGIGKLIIVDRDYVEFSNLQRQSLFDENDAAESRPKALAATRKIKSFNSEVEVIPFAKDLTPANLELLEGADLVLDGTDNFETRFLINDYCVERGTPWIYCAAVGSYGLKLPVIPGITACLRCLYPEPPEGAQPTCETDGVLAPATSAIAAVLR